MSAKLQRALQDAGVQGARARVDATGEACGSYFAKQYSTYVIEAAVPDLNDTAHLDALTEKATGVIRALQASSEIRQVNSSWKNRFQINFESGGERKFRPISDR